MKPKEDPAVGAGLTLLVTRLLQSGGGLSSLHMTNVNPTSL